VIKDLVAVNNEFLRTTFVYLEPNDIVNFFTGSPTSDNNESTCNY
jgi:hypothetical protein